MLAHIYQGIISKIMKNEMKFPQDVKILININRVCCDKLDLILDCDTKRMCLLNYCDNNRSYLHFGKILNDTFILIGNYCVINM